MNFVAPDLVSGILYIPTGYQIWKDLRERFDTIDGTRVFHLHCEIYTIQQCTSSISLDYAHFGMSFLQFLDNRIVIVEVYHNLTLFKRI